MAAIALLSLVGLLFADMTVDAAAEDAVGGLVLSSDEPGVLAISWDAHDPLPTDYRVNWSKTGEDFPASREDDGNAYPTTNAQTLGGLEPGVEYQVRVRARYFDGDVRLSSGDWSETASLTVAAAAEDAVAGLRQLEQRTTASTGARRATASLTVDAGEDFPAW